MIPLLVDLETEWRGGQNQFLLLLTGLYEHGHAAELLVSEGSVLGHRAAKAGFCVHHVSRGMLRLPAAKKIRKLMSDGRFDVVHVNESHALTAAWLARAHKRAPLIISRRVGYPLANRKLARARYFAARRIIANSHWVAERAAESGAPKEKITVVYEGVRIPPIPTAEDRERARARWGVSAEQILTGCVGVLSPDKGQEWVIRALRELQREFPACRLVLAGEGPDRARLEGVAREAGVLNSVLFAGFVKDMEAIYQALDLFVFPALYEGLGTSLLAAMSFGIPSITYFGCALGEIVENGVSGIQVEARKPEEIAAAAAKILRDPKWAAALGGAGRKRIEGKFSAEAMVEGTIKIYHEALAE
ncbi:MAG TPA: glycosyltransferase family 4 protein [Terriglobales bacterium]|nr:glycosyltransferase family 4 protein [Terriglobales bacterium]